MNEKMELPREDHAVPIERQLTGAKSYIKHLEAKVERLNGEIEGLRFAIRCNGVSGGDVR